MPFVVDGQPRIIACGSNFHSLRPGVGALLFLKYLESSPTALLFGGSDDSHAIIRRRGWTYYPAPRTYTLNRRYEAANGDRAWRRAAKRLVDRAVRRPLAAYASRIPADVRGRLQVMEEQDYKPDMLPETSPFRLRFAPPVEYLRWRYGLALPFARYRLFRIVSRGMTSGYVVVGDAPGQLTVAHADGTNAADLAYGMVLSLIAAARNDELTRSGLLTSAHPEMERVFSSIGFRASRHERPLAMGGGGTGRPDAASMSDWLVNFDWGDNGLRVPFLDQSATS
jgi:hypothetical protein